MFDFNTLPIPGGVIVAGIAWAAISAALGQVVAERTIQNSGWIEACEQGLRAETLRQRPQSAPTPEIACDQVMGLLGQGADALCDQGGDQLFELLNADPLAGQREQLRQREENRLARIAALAPTRCSCAASTVRADRLSWGLFAGSARFLGGPDDLQADLTRALHSSACAFSAED